jgi:hypothetical protein
MIQDWFIWFFGRDLAVVMGIIFFISMMAILIALLVKKGR